MEYEQIPEPCDLSCKGCFFNREVIRDVYKKQKNGSYTLQSRKPTGNFGCYAPSEPPFKGCKERRVIFKEK